MMWRLAVRLIRGGGVAGGIRLVLMVVGIGVGVAAGAMVAAMPGVLDGQDAVIGARLPTPVESHDHEHGDDEGGDHEHNRGQFMFTHVDDVWNGERLGRMWLADASGGAPRPPGVDRFPSPGEAVVSPALAERMEVEPALDRLVDAEVVGTIAPVGLLGPDELYAYIGVAAEDLADLHAGGGWGNPDPYALESQQAGLSQGLALLILPAAGIYLMVCGRLASATRARRYAALRLLGLRRSAILRIAAVENGIAGGLGGLLGVGLFTLMYPILAGSGWLGFTWFPETGQLGVVPAGLLVVVVAGVSAGLGAVGLRRALSRPVEGRADLEEPPSRWWLLLPLAGGLGAMTYLLLLPQLEQDALAINPWVALGGLVLAVGGLLLGVRPLLAGAGRILSRPHLPWPVRIAGRRLVREPAAMVRLLAGLVLLVLVAGIGAGVLRDQELLAGPAGSSYSVWIEGHQVRDAVTREQLYGLPAAHRWTVTRSTIPDEIDPSQGLLDVREQIQQLGLSLISMECGQLQTLVGEDLPDCRDGRIYRLLTADLVGSPYELPVDTEVTFLDQDGQEVALVAPRESLVVAEPGTLPISGYGALLATRDGPQYGWSEQLRIEMLLPGDPGALDEFKSAAAALSPGTFIAVAGEDIAMVEQYRNRHGVLSFGVTTGFLLAALAFAVAAVDRALQRRHDVAVLVVLGVRGRAIRVVQLIQLMAPLVLILIATLLVGHLAGNLALRVGDLHRPWYVGTFAAMGPLVAIAIVAAAAAGLLVVGRHLRAEDLRRE